MPAYESLKQRIRTEPKTWLTTGVAGFIGSNLLEAVLILGRRVVGLDNLGTGYQRNVVQVNALGIPEQWANFSFIQGDVRNPNDCRGACDVVDYVLHQAAFGSDSRSIDDPITIKQKNIDTVLYMRATARDANVKRFVYAASRSTCGDPPPDLPQVEDKIGKPLSLYAITKLVNEIYADFLAKTHGVKTIGLRYCDFFGRRRNPDGAHAAVFP